ncbi:uncharacterized protein G2W53_031527 [Senna tora]|uniref:Uncharacterized protein n=1 Tax=Senna tora TaxID=362788 RepID=A0A834T8Y1_9FABA|nr:uncharacterized protein G2W53_031527 [Senna tora]
MRFVAFGVASMSDDIIIEESGAKKLKWDPYGCDVHVHGRD